MTSEKYISLATELGTISGRDAIYLDGVEYDVRNTSLKLTGEINSSLCSISGSQHEFIPYCLTFSGVLWVDIVELDFHYREYKASLFEVLNSARLQEYLKRDHSSKLSSDHRHYVVRTYDDVIETIASKYLLAIKG